MNLCKYRNMFGKVGEGVHAYRILNIAIVDVALTILGGYLLHVATAMSFPLACLLLFLLGIVCHRLFCVHTTIDQILFKS
jgi:hypothetical protein